MEHLSPSGEKHWWTMTSECPMCLREENARLKDKLARVVEAAERMAAVAGIAEPATRRYAAENLMAALAAAKGE